MASFKLKSKLLLLNTPDMRLIVLKGQMETIAGGGGTGNTSTGITIQLFVSKVSGDV